MTGSISPLLAGATPPPPSGDEDRFEEDASGRRVSYVCEDGTRLAFRQRRTRGGVIPWSRATPLSFLEGLKIASESHEDVGAVARDHGYSKSWVPGIVRGLEHGREALSVETVLMLRESMPWLDYQMSVGRVLWPVTTASEYVQRPGPQTDVRVADQEARRRG